MLLMNTWCVSSISGLVHKSFYFIYFALNHVCLQPFGCCNMQRFCKIAWFHKWGNLDRLLPNKPSCRRCIDPTCINGESKFSCQRDIAPSNKSRICQNTSRLVLLPDNKYDVMTTIMLEIDFHTELNISSLPWNDENGTSFLSNKTKQAA